MGCGGCGGKKPKRIKAVDPATAPTSAIVVDGYNMIIFEYIGQQHGPFRVNGLEPTNARYKFGKTQSSRFGYVYPHDVAYLLSKRNQDGSPWFKVVEPEPVVKEEVKKEDFVGQKVEDIPEPKPEPEPQESFIFDVQMKELTIRSLKELLLDKKYLRQDILLVLINQEIDGKNRKTALKILKDEIGKLL